MEAREKMIKAKIYTLNNRTNYIKNKTERIYMQEVFIFIVSSSMHCAKLYNPITTVLSRIKYILLPYFQVSYSPISQCSINKNLIVLFVFWTNLLSFAALSTLFPSPIFFICQLLVHILSYYYYYFPISQSYFPISQSCCISLLLFLFPYFPVLFPYFLVLFYSSIIFPISLFPSPILLVYYSVFPSPISPFFLQV